MTEYAAFNDEGCIADGFTTLVEAQEAAQAERDEGDVHAFAAEVCPDHDEQPRQGCEECVV